MEKTYTEIDYKNMEGYEVTFEKWVENDRSCITLRPMDKEGDESQDRRYFTISEAYRTIIALQKVLKAHDDNYEEKMMSIMEGKETIQ